jgi:hypothetical protein
MNNNEYHTIIGRLEKRAIKERELGIYQ